MTERNYATAMRYGFGYRNCGRQPRVDLGVVPTLGVTFTCQFEPVQAVAEALDQLEKEEGLDIPIHVDKASGGFLAPFCAPEVVWDSRIPRVKSINSSGHKFGLAPLGVGWVIWREAADLPDDLLFWVNYLGGNMRDIALNLARRTREKSATAAHRVSEGLL